MADIAAVFHWEPSAFADMSIARLVRWRELAVSRWRRMNGIKDD